MFNDPPVRTHGIIRDARQAGLYLAELPNGKTVLAHPAKHLKQGPVLSPGDRVILELTPYDFDTARIAEILPSQS